jgi:hypothetical protein
MSSFFRTCPHFQGLNYRPGGIYKIKANVRKLGVFSFYSSSQLLNNEMKAMTAWSALMPS